MEVTDSRTHLVRGAERADAPPLFPRVHTDEGIAGVEPDDVLADYVHERAATGKPSTAAVMEASGSETPAPGSSGPRFAYPKGLFALSPTVW
jgi:hypothetical protein